MSLGSHVKITKINIHEIEHMPKSINIVFTNSEFITIWRQKIKGFKTNSFFGLPDLQDVFSSLRDNHHWSFLHVANHQ